MTAQITAEYLIIQSREHVHGTYSSSIHTIPLNHPSTEIYIGTTGGCASLNTGSVECWGPIPRLANEALGYPSSSPVYGTNFPSTVWELLPSNSVASQPSQNGVKVLGMDGPADSSQLRNMCIVLMNGDLQCYGLTYGVFNPNWPSDASTQIFASDQPGVLNTVSAFGTPATMTVSDGKGGGGGGGGLSVFYSRMRLCAALETTKEAS